MASQLLAMSFDSPASPTISLREGRFAAPDAAGWGFAWYPMGDTAAVVIKDPRAAYASAWTRVFRDWERFRSNLFVCHTHAPSRRITQQDTHPFHRSYAGHDWVFAHAGELGRPEALREALPVGEDAPFEPMGVTDSEHAFCWLLGRLRSEGARSLREVGDAKIARWLDELNRFGSLNLLLSDGRDLLAYRDLEARGELYWIRRTPPHETTLLNGDAVVVDLGEPTDVNRSMILVSTTPLSDEDGWSPLEPGQVLLARGGAFVGGTEERPEAKGDRSSEVVGMLWTETTQGRIAQSQNAPTPLSPRPLPRTTSARSATTDRIRGVRFAPTERIMTVEHETVYRYKEAVELSTHVLRLQPTHDTGQEVLDYQLEISPPGIARRAEDVFGNQTLRLRVERSYQELWMRARSRVRIHDTAQVLPHRRATIPLVWMPWQRQMMTPYLLPPELPETQLGALSEYAMSFVERQDYDLVETLRDVNQSIYRDFSYVPGSTMLETSPFSVFVSREGVCQDFANLFICLARLLGVPARYRCGYIHTGADYENTLQSEASHAWAEVYMPRLGWRGFDPTNGIAAGLDHVRVAVGRNYRDATPTSGTIFHGGKGESLETSVRVQVESERARP